MEEKEPKTGHLWPEMRDFGAISLDFRQFLVDSRSRKIYQICQQITDLSVIWAII